MNWFPSAYIALGSIILLAALAQSITGFGFSIVAMSFLPEIVSLKTAVPLVILVTVVGNFAMWFYYRRDYNLKAVGRLTIASLVTTPVGTFLLARWDEGLALKGLGLLIISYVFYDWLSFSLPNLTSSLWAYIFGSASGILNGAYTINGPPVIMYAHCRGWNPQEFKGNLTAFFSLSSVLAAIAHGLQGNITADVWNLAISTLPIYGCGLWWGIILSRNINPVVFRRITLVLLAIAGSKLLW